MAFDIRSKPAERRWMIGAIALSAVSQFFLYLNDGSDAALYDTTNPDYYTQMVVFSPAAIGSGWQLHPQAFVLLPALAVLFVRDDLLARRWLPRYGYWLAVAMLFFCAVPGAPFRNALGAILGLVAVALGIVAAILQRRARAGTPPADKTAL
jgi:hypothetical protein